MPIFVLSARKKRKEKKNLKRGVFTAAAAFQKLTQLVVMLSSVQKEKERDFKKVYYFNKGRVMYNSFSSDKE